MQHILGSMSVAQFLAEYWQQKPLLIRQGFQSFDPIITPDELAGLACETDDARIVHEVPNAPHWQVQYGPFDETDFATLPDSHWTLLVNQAEALLPELHCILAPFRFIPDWRIDDLMISFAVPEGSVGPHIDEYDVFLIQGYGQRHWHINTQPDTHLLPDMDLRILANFQSEEDWILSPGDILYLPPGVAHHGIALDNCMTYSVGFRAPHRADMLEEWLQDTLSETHNYQRLQDIQRPVQNQPAEISHYDMERLYNLLIGELKNKEALYQWIGRYLTKRQSDEIANSVPKNRLTSHLLKNPNIRIRRCPNVRFNYYIDQQHLYLFCGGHSLPLSKEQLDFVLFLCNSPLNQTLNIKKFVYYSDKSNQEIDLALKTKQKNYDLLLELLKLRLIVLSK